MKGHLARMTHKVNSHKVLLEIPEIIIRLGIFLAIVLKYILKNSV